MQKNSISVNSRSLPTTVAAAYQVLFFYQLPYGASSHGDVCEGFSILYKHLTTETPT